MPTPYLSRLKLEKELEKKAKMLREKKVRCEKYMEKLEGKLNELRKWVEVESLEKLFEEGKREYEIKNYDEAIKKFEEVEKVIKEKSREEYSRRRKKIEDVINKMKSGEASSFLDELKRADEVLSEDPMKSFNLLASLEGRILKAIEADFQSKKMALLERMASIEGYEWVKDKIESIEFKGLESIERLSQIEDEAIKKLREEIGEILSKADKLLEVASSAHYNLPVDKNEKDRVLKLLREGSYGEALEGAKSYYEEVKKSFSTFFNKLLGISRMIVEEGKMMELDMETQLKGIEKAEELMKKGNFEEAIELLRKATEEAENVKLQHVMKVIKDLREKFVEAKEREIDLEPYMKMIENSKNLLKIGRHKRAYDLVKEAINMLDRRLNLYAQLDSELRNLKEVVEDLRKENILLEGVNGRIEEIEKLLEEDVEKAEKKIDELKGVIKINLRDIATSLYNDLRELVEKGMEASIELTEIKSELDKIEEMFRDEAYKEAILMLRDMEEKLYDKIYEYISEEIKELGTYEVEEMKKKAEEIGKHLDDGDIKKALYDFLELRNMMYKREMKEIEEKIKEIEEKVKFLEDRDVNVAEIKMHLEKAREKLKEGKIENVRSHLERGETLMNRVRSRVVLESMESSKSVIEGIENLGVDTEKVGIKKLWEDMQKLFEEKKFEEVIDIAGKIKELAKDLREKVLKAKSVISELENEIRALEKEGVDTSSLREDIEGIHNLMKTNEYEKVEERAKELKSKIREVRESHLLEKVREEIESLRPLFKDAGKIKEYKGMVNKFLKSFGKRDRKELLKDGREILQKLGKEAKKILEKRMEDAKKQLERFKSKGLYIVAEIEELEKIKEDIFRGDYVKSYERLEALERKLEDIRKREKRIVKLNESIKDKLNFAHSLGIDIKDYEKKMSEIYLARSYGEMEEMVKTLMENLEGKIRDKLNKIIEDVEKELDVRRKRGEDITAAEALLTKARSNINSKNYKLALKFALDAMGEIENFEMQKVTAMGILRRVEEKMKKMRTLIPRDILRGYQEAKSIFLKGDYRSSIEKAMEISERLWDIERVTEKIKERNQQIKELVVKLHRSGMDVKNVLKLFNQAKVEYQKLHYLEAYKLVERAYEEAKKLMEEVLNGYKKIYEEMLKRIREFELEKYFEESLDAIDDLFTKEDIEALKVRLSSLREELDSKVREVIEEKINALKERAELLRKLGGEIDIEEEEKKLRELKEKNLEEFKKYYAERYAEIEKKIVEGIRKEIEALNKKLGEYEKLGINMNEYYEKVSTYLSELNTENYEEIHRSLEELKARLSSYINEYVRGYMENIVKKVERYSKEKALEFKERMEEMVKNGKYEGLLEISKEADNFIAYYKLNVEDLNKKVKELKELMVQALNLGIDIQGYTGELKEVLSHIKDIRETIANVEDIERRIREEMEKLEPKISVKLDVKGRVDDRYRCVLSIKNEGNADAIGVKIRIEGELKGERELEITKLPKGGKESLDIFLVPGEGEETVIKITYRRFDGKEFRVSEKLTVGIRKKGFHVEKNKEKVKCAFCRGTILPGMDIVICDNCGAVYHLPCARRAGRCVKCGTLFNFE